MKKRKTYESRGVFITKDKIPSGFVLLKDIYPKGTKNYDRISKAWQDRKMPGSVYREIVDGVCPQHQPMWVDPEVAKQRIADMDAVAQPEAIAPESSKVAEDLKNLRDELSGLRALLVALRKTDTNPI